jgi:NADH:quinone reductase (non-electrogenic)
MNKTRIVILGGGYSGVMAARRLALKTSRQAVEITLVNGLDHFVQRIRLHQTAVNQTVSHLPMSHMVAGSGVRFMQGWATQITPENHTLTIQTAEGAQSLGYDYLIYALGSYIDTSRVPGAAEHALSVSTEESTLRLREKLLALPQGGRVVICGGGLTGIEISTELAEAYPNLNVSLITREDFGAQLSQRGQAYLRQTFDRLGIDVTDNATITRISPDQVEYAGGALDFDLCIWAGAFAVPTLARESGLAVNAQGQVIVDDHLRSVSHPTVYTVGDAANPSDAIGTPIRMACATAVPMGSYAADDLAARLNGKTHRAYDFGYAIRCISLGRHNGLVQMVEHDDTPKEQVFTGRMGAFIKEMVCRYAFWQVQNPRWMYYTSNKTAKHTATPEKLAEAAH